VQLITLSFTQKIPTVLSRVIVIVEISNGHQYSYAAAVVYCSFTLVTIQKISIVAEL